MRRRRDVLAEFARFGNNNNNNGLQKKADKEEEAETEDTFVIRLLVSRMRDGSNKILAGEKLEGRLASLRGLLFLHHLVLIFHFPDLSSGC